LKRDWATPNINDLEAERKTLGEKYGKLSFGKLRAKAKKSS
jgi:hypothetical protein